MSLDSWRDVWWRHEVRNHECTHELKARMFDEITQGVSIVKEEEQALSPGVLQHKRKARREKPART